MCGFQIWGILHPQKTDGWNPPIDGLGRCFTSFQGGIFRFQPSVFAGSKWYNSCQIVETSHNLGPYTSQVMQDFFHQRYISQVSRGLVLADRRGGPLSPSPPPNATAGIGWLVEVWFKLHSWRVKFDVALPKFNSSPLKSYLPNRKVVFQPSFFRGELLNFRCVTCSCCSVGSWGNWNMAFEPSVISLNQV